MTKDEWNNWFPKFRSKLSEIDRLWVDQSEELQNAIDAEDYWLAEDIVLEIINSK
jgi:hypothetical protein